MSSPMLKRFEEMQLNGIEIIQMAKECRAYCLCFSLMYLFVSGLHKDNQLGFALMFCPRQFSILHGHLNANKMTFPLKLPTANDVIIR